MLLRPESEIAAQGWVVGERAAVDFGPEVKARDGQAVVESIRPAAAPSAGTGRVVTGTFQTWTQDLRELWMEGLGQPVRVTGGHRFQVEAGSAWVPVHDLRPGDRIRTLDGTGRRVTGVEALPGRHQVFNLEVEGVHQYHVSPAGLLTHNNDCNTSSAKDVASEASETVQDAVPAAKTTGEHSAILRKKLQSDSRPVLPDEDAAHIVASGHPRCSVASWRLACRRESLARRPPRKVRLLRRAPPRQHPVVDDQPRPPRTGGLVTNMRTSPAHLTA